MSMQFRDSMPRRSAPRLRRWPVALIVLTACSSVALAHRIDVAAIVDHDGVHATVKDAYGVAISDANIEVTDPDGTVLAQGRTDADGRFTFTLETTPEHVNIVAKTTDGHRASLTLSREQLVHPNSVSIQAEHEHGHEHGVGVANENQAESTTSTHADTIASGMSEIEILQALFVRQQAALDDIQEELLRINRSQSGIAPETAVAGLGFIFGLTGLITACYALRRASGRES